MTDEIFYLPKHPINEEKHVLGWFYTNDNLGEVTHFALMKPMNLAVLIGQDDIPADASVLKLTYKRTEKPNCEGVSRYELDAEILALIEGK